MRQLCRYDDQYSTGETDELLLELALAHASEITNVTTRERVVASLTGDVLYSVCDLDFPYEQWSTHDAIHVRQCAAFFSKRCDIDRGVDTRAIALEKFEESEILCKESNQIFKSHAAGRLQFRPAVEGVLHDAKRKIAEILGDLPSLSEMDYKFGPGATTQVKKRDACARVKLGQSIACSEELLPYASAFLEEMPEWAYLQTVSRPNEDADSERLMIPIEIHKGIVDFVPKSAKEQRTILKEPALNTMVQGAQGRVILKRLRAVGVDLKDQRNNQRLALEGSLTGALATLDLSSASDTISIGVVEHLLPHMWFEFLAIARTGNAYLPLKDKTELHWRLEKFSTMGNGFTFPLESLVFYGLAWATADAVDPGSPVSVYGDDIIVSSKAYPLLCDVLHSCGFKVNKTKSFASGPFRESCGKDYLSGIDIRPVYVKDRLMGADLFVLHNFYVRKGQSSFAQLVLEHIADPLKKWGPDGFGDGHLLGAWEPVPHRRYSADEDQPSGWAGYTFETYSFKGPRQFKPLPGDAIIPLYTIYVSPVRPGLPGLDWTEADWCSKLPRAFAGTGRPRTRVGYHNGSEVRALWSTRKECAGDILPGVESVKLISIYTLTPL